MRENCLKEFDAHWQCLEKSNQVRPIRHLQDGGHHLTNVYTTVTGILSLP